MNEIYHYGILGQKWGVRRFQNQDGSLTSAGRKRYDSKENRQKIFEQSVKTGKDKTNISPAEKTAKDAAHIVEDVQKINSAISDIIRNNKKIANDTRQLSDDELRKAISRMNLERQYSDLSSKNVNKGIEFTNSILSIIGSTVSIVGTASGIIATVYAIKKGGGQ